MKPIKSIAFIVNKNKEGAKALAESLAEIASKEGVETTITEEYPVPQNFLEGKDACCVIGGDGTILGVIEESIRHEVPTFGINQGKLGFLATFSPEEAKDHFPSLLGGEYKITPRAVLECRAKNGKVDYALNDVVIKNHDPYRVTEINVSLNDDFVTSYTSDGLILSTATGSTAYNLSAGGPIINPGTKVFAMTPICPHTLSNRSVIFSSNDTVAVDCPGNDKGQANLDGRVNWKGSEIFPLHVTISEKSLPLLQRKNYSYFEILRKKLKW